MQNTPSAREGRYNAKIHPVKENLRRLGKSAQLIKAET
jgi:hypothetical protein